VREDSAEAQKSKNPLRIRKEVKAQEEQRRGERRRKNSKRSRQGARRERKEKGRGLWELEILPRLGRKCASSGGSTAAVRSAGEEIWTVGFYVQEASGEAYRRGRS
jgi:hypothetical protein